SALPLVVRTAPVEPIPSVTSRCPDSPRDTNLPRHVNIAPPAGDQASLIIGTTEVVWFDSNRSMLLCSCERSGPAYKVSVMLGFRDISSNPKIVWSTVRATLP